MTYHGAHLLTNVEVFTVFWSSACGHRVATETIADSYPGDGKTVPDDQIRAALHACGYHNVDGNLYYAVEPYLDGFGCDFTGMDVISNLTKVSSHELCEAITDADLNGWSGEQTIGGSLAGNPYTAVVP